MNPTVVLLIPTREVRRRIQSSSLMGARHSRRGSQDEETKVSGNRPVRRGDRPGGSGEHRARRVWDRRQGHHECWRYELRRRCRVRKERHDRRRRRSGSQRYNLRFRRDAPHQRGSAGPLVLGRWCADDGPGRFRHRRRCGRAKGRRHRRGRILGRNRWPKTSGDGPLRGRRRPGSDVLPGRDSDLPLRRQGCRASGKSRFKATARS